MTTEAIFPERLRRFILTSIPSVPFLEAMLLLRDNPARDWDGKTLAQRLYMGEKAASQLLAELHEAAVVRPALGADQKSTTGMDANEGSPACYRYAPGSEDLRQMIDLLAEAYSRHLVAVTNLIHSKTSKRAQHFADAFKWRKDS